VFDPDSKPQGPSREQRRRVKPNGAPPRESEKHSRSNNLTGLALVSMAISITMSGGCIYPPHDASWRDSEQIQDELNIKAIEVIPRDAALVTYRINPNLPVMGKRYGTLIPAIRATLEQSDSSIIAKLAARGELLKIEVEGQTIELAPDAPLIETTAAEGFACAEDAGYLVGLDTTLTDELVHEGLIRGNSKNRTGCP
jgi:isoleucyl-tRNA synthetase